MGLSKVWIIPFLTFLLSTAAFFVSYVIAVSNEHVQAIWPYISDSGTQPPESCIFAQLLNMAALFLACTIYLRHRQIVEFYWHQHQQEGKWRAMSCFLLFLGYSSALGVSMVGNFQENNVKIVHYFGALLAFGCGLLYSWAQTVFSYMMNPKLAKPIVSHCRLILTLLATLFFTSMIVFANLAERCEDVNECNRTITHRWTDVEDGYSFHLIATISEWLLAICFQLYILSFAIELRHAYCHAPKLRLVAYFTDKISESEISLKSSKPVTCCSGFTTEENNVETYEIPKYQFHELDFKPTNFLNMDYFEKSKTDNYSNLPLGLEAADFVDPARQSAFDQSISRIRF